MKGKIHLHPKANTNGFDKNPQNIAGKGKSVSIKSYIERILSDNGATQIPKEQVIKVNDDGSVVIKVPTQEALAMKLLAWAMSRKGNDSIKAIQMIMDYFDKKEPTSLEVTSKDMVIAATDELINSYYCPEQKKWLKIGDN